MDLDEKPKEETPKPPKPDTIRITVQLIKKPNDSEGKVPALLIFETASQASTKETLDFEDPDLHHMVINMVRMGMAHAEQFYIATYGKPILITHLHGHDPLRQN